MSTTLLMKELSHSQCPLLESALFPFESVTLKGKEKLHNLATFMNTVIIIVVIPANAQNILPMNT